MAKRKFNITTAAIVAGAVGGAYYLYQKYKKNALTPAQKTQEALDKIKAKQAAAEALKNQQNANNAAASTFDDLNNPNSFAGKVGTIQRVLGVSIDGKPGPQTNNAYKKRFGLDRGPIGVMNLDYYLKKATVDNVYFQI